MALCDAEKTFILHGVEEDFRVDGRQRQQYRPMELENNVVSHAFGSARLRLANTDVLVAVKIEVDAPFPDLPHEGKIEFFVDCSANATPDFEGRGGEDLGIEIANSLAAAYKSTKAFDLAELCIMKGRKCWKLLVDILILECGGNLYDAVSIAVKAALWDTHVPLVRSVNLDGNKVEMDVSENLNDCKRLKVTGTPLMVTMCKIGEHCVVDPSSDEEHCSTAALVVAVSQGRFTTVLQSAPGAFISTTLLECLKIAQEVATNLDNSLTKILAEAPLQKDVGFLS